MRVHQLPKSSLLVRRDNVDPNFRESHHHVHAPTRASRHSYLTSPVLITTNKPFSQWAEVFSSAACVVTLVDRLIHRSE